MLLYHTQRRSTVGRTPLDEWSARRRDLYLTTHDTHNRQISMPPLGFEPKISAGERPCRLCCVVVCDLETSRMGAPYIDDISRLRVKHSFQFSNVTLLKSKCLQLGTLTVRCTRKGRNTVLKSADIPIPLYPEITNVLVRTLFISPHTSRSRMKPVTRNGPNLCLCFQFYFPPTFYRAEH